MPPLPYLWMRCLTRVARLATQNGDREVLWPVKRYGKAVVRAPQSSHRYPSTACPMTLVDAIGGVLGDMLPGSEGDAKGHNIAGTVDDFDY
jgi:hypothetical protein